MEAARRELPIEPIRDLSSSDFETIQDGEIDAALAPLNVEPAVVRSLPSEKRAAAHNANEADIAATAERMAVTLTSEQLASLIAKSDAKLTELMTAQTPRFTSVAGERNVLLALTKAQEIQKIKREEDELAKLGE